ncbi:sensor domain-containing protein [Microvirga makkahensis]|uniref:EAL domain-containing protein n=1 Tax=Microvirga makkahensis TaxID=1128670 RepID=A0A7X3MWP5_9HYPH|nr:EAL domain-containing protein [Microvirga makkahensis]MXQ14428.1 EAL domain-containing protein [Microvirga makkahensis]
MRFWDHSWLRQLFIGNRGSSGIQCEPHVSPGLSSYALAIVESTSDCVFFLDPDWRFTFCNARAAAELKVTADITGSHIWDRFPSTIGTIFEENCRRAMTERSTRIFEGYLEPLSSWYEVHATPAGSDLMVVLRNINDRRAAAEALRAREQQLATVVGQTMVGILHRNLQARVLMVNQRFCDMVGRNREELDGLPLREFTHPEDIERSTALLHKHLESAEPFQVEKRYVRPDGTALWCAVNVSFVCDETGKPVSTIAVAEDINTRKMAQEEARESQRQLATFIDNLPGIVYQCSSAAPWPFSLISEGAEALTGYSAGEFLDGGISWGDIIHPDDRPMVEEAILDSIRSKQVFEIVYRIRTRSGEIRWMSDRGQCICGSSGEPRFLEGIISDVTAQKEAEEKILWAAHHDHLTRLPNRALFQIRLSKALEQSASRNCKLGLVILDVDHLKEINDTLGHDAGDVVLQAVASRLSAAVRPIDTVARNGGDEFAIVFPEIASEQDIKALIAPIQEQLHKPLLYAGRTLDCRASIGASIWPDHASEAADLLKQADIALYTAKATGRDKVMVFEPAMRTEAQRKAEMRNNARGAIDARSIEPFYQPKVRLSSGDLAGFEALLRWRNRQAGIELPASIQAAFDDPHLAVALSEQMHDMVFDDMRRWLQSGVPFGHVAINASAAEFRGMNFADRVLERLRSTEVPPHCLEIEVTETVFLGRGAEFIEMNLRTLSAEGVKIALDDFGTGYASLSHLKQFPVDIIKIDRSFVHDLASNPDDPAILQAVVSLGKRLGITTVAEGVETAVQAAFLRNQGCDLGQGFLFGMASPSKLIPDLVASWNPDQFNLPELDTLFLKDRKQRR